MIRTWVYSLLNDRRGQDLVEYALMGGFIAVVVGASSPQISTGISTVFSQIGAAVASAATQGTTQAY
jgi:Flp pilus assembly pilin Flp